MRTALEFFEGIGARAFAERTRRELTATGEHSRPRSDATRDLLTPQEAQIARLVADGMKNAEIASQLYISRSTVEYHLRKIYRKLGITTRTQLASVEFTGEPPFRSSELWHGEHAFARDDSGERDARVDIELAEHFRRCESTV